MDPGGLMERYARDVYPHVVAPLQWLSDRSPVPVVDVLTVCGCAASLLAAMHWRPILSWVRSHKRDAIALGALCAVYVANMAAPLARVPKDAVLREPVHVASVADRKDAIDRSLDILLRDYDPAARPPEPAAVNATVLAYLRREGEPTIPSRGVARSSLIGAVQYVLGALWGITNPMALHREVDVPLPSDTVMYPSTLAHEFAHQQGFGQERYAQFIAYAALIESDDPRLRSSAALDRLMEEVGVLRRAGVKMPPLDELLPDQILADYDRVLRSPPQGLGWLAQSAEKANELLLRSSGQGSPEVAYGSRYLDLVHAWETKRAAATALITTP